MALPGFYNQGDQEIYEGGEHFIPQEQYRLGYTAPPSIANTPTGITNTQAAYPYKWPPLQGAGDGPSGLHNVYGYDPNKTKTFSKQVWSKTGPTEGWTTQDVTGYWSPSGWKTAKGKNINHAGLEVPTLIGTLMNKAMGIKPGEKRVGDIKGTFTDKKISDIFGKKETSPVETIDIRDKFDRTAEEEDETLDIPGHIRRQQIINRRQIEKNPIVFGMGDVIDEGTGDQKVPPRFPPSTWTPAGGNGGGTGSPGGGAQAAGDLAGGSALDSPFAEGGRIGYGLGDIVKGWFSGGPESETNPTLFGTQNSLLNKASIAQLKNAIGLYQASGELDQEQQLDYELKLKQLEALIAGSKGQAEGGLIGYFDGGIARLL